MTWGAGTRPPIRCFVGTNDKLWFRFAKQWEGAKTEAKAHQFPVSEKMLPNKGHVPLADEVLGWFANQ